MKGVLIKYKDTGTEDPFNARMMFGVMKLRDAFIKNDEEERLKFDNLYQPIFESLDDCINCKKQFVDLITLHKKKISSKEIVGFQNNGAILEIHESIDREMNRLFKDFFIKGEIALKGLQKLTKTYGLDIGFFFQDDKAFQKGAEHFLAEGRSDTKAVVEMLTSDRKWHTTFNEIRIAIEHGGFSLGRIKYHHDIGGNVIVYIPKINDKDLDEVVSIMSNNVFEFIEDVIAMTASRNIKDPLCVIQIPENKRDPSLPIKYTVGVDGMPIF
ncbi:MAG: hypothetical protein NUV37_03005 [Nanoarchaeota archaeon]|nr:hypothetical protein [Nanoarchaeota archaeon]